MGGLTKTKALWKSFMEIHLLKKIVSKYNVKRKCWDKINAFGIDLRLVPSEGISCLVLYSHGFEGHKLQGRTCCYFTSGHAA